MDETRAQKTEFQARGPSDYLYIVYNQTARSLNNPDTVNFFLKAQLYT